VTPANNVIFASLSIPESTVQEKLAALTGSSSLALLYRGSRDGYGRDAVASRVDGKGATLVVVKSEHNKVFGGYMPIPWKRDHYGRQDNATFLFTIRDDHSIETFQSLKGAGGGWCSDDWLFVFGASLLIHADCDKNPPHSYVDHSGYGEYF
jgi:hypothetical protein